MGFFDGFKNWFNQVEKAFVAFIQEAFNAEMKSIIAQYAPIAVGIVAKLSATDLTSDAKRKQAFDEIKATITAQGKTTTDNMINILIELALSKVKLDTQDKKPS